MKTLISTVIAAAIISSISGCATDPGTRVALSQHFEPIEVHQLGDMALSCEELTANINEVSGAISALDKQIAAQQQASTGFSILSAIASVSGTYAPNFHAAQLSSAEGTLANTGAAIEGGQAMNKQGLRAMYENRHDVLMQIFYGKSCK
jgi:hypothetical protein